MNKLQITLLNLIKLSLFQNREQNILINQDEWPDLIAMIFEQKLGLILFPVLDYLPDDSKPDSQLYNYWKNMVLIGALSQLRKYKQIENILTILNKSSSIILLKGLAIARFYNPPEYRTMSDLDILVEPNYKNQAQNLIESMGYTMMESEKDHPFHYGYGKNGEIYIELHYSLYAPGIMGRRNMRTWYDNIWRKSKRIVFEGIDLHIMAEEDELINQILHFATHIVYSGARMAHLYDIALIIKHCHNELDWQYIEDTLKSIKLLKFGMLIFTICNKYYNVTIPNTLLSKKGIGPDEFMNVFFNEYSVWKDDKDKGISDKFASKYPLLCKYAALVPAVSLIEIIFQLIRNKRTIGEALVVTKQNIKIFYNQMRILKRIDLIKF